MYDNYYYKNSLQVDNLGIKQSLIVYKEKRTKDWSLWRLWDWENSFEMIINNLEMGNIIGYVCYQMSILITFLMKDITIFKNFRNKIRLQSVGNIRLLGDISKILVIVTLVLGRY